jgi:hypothetical protein
MPRFLVTIHREDSFTAEIETEAVSAEDAKVTVNKRLLMEGWGRVVGGEQDELKSCLAYVEDVLPLRGDVA